MTILRISLLVGLMVTFLVSGCALDWTEPTSSEPLTQPLATPTPATPIPTATPLPTIVEVKPFEPGQVSPEDGERPAGTAQDRAEKNISLDPAVALPQAGVAPLGITTGTGSWRYGQKESEVSVRFNNGKPGDERVDLRFTVRCAQEGTDCELTVEKSWDFNGEFLATYALPDFQAVRITFPETSSVRSVIIFRSGEFFLHFGLGL